MSAVMKAGLLDDAGLEQIDTEAREIAAEAADFADESPKPGPDALYANVWATENEHGRLFFDGRDR